MPTEDSGLLDAEGKPFLTEVVDAGVRPPARLAPSAATENLVHFSLQQFGFWLVEQGTFGSHAQALGLVEDFWTEVIT